MSEALTAEPSGPQTDTLVEQHDDPRAAEVKADPPPKPSLDDTLKAEVEKAVKGEKPEEKPEEKQDAKGKQADDAKPEPKPKPAEAVKDDAKDGDPVALKDPKESEAPKPTAYRDPPNGFDDAAKKEWEATPESVRGAMHRRAQEMERGIHKYRQEAEQFEPLRQYADMAKQSGTDLQTALQRYTTMEQELRRDPIAGLEAVVANLGLKGPNGQPATFRDVAAHVLGQNPDQNASRQEATISRLTQQVQSLTQQLGGFSEHVEQQKQQGRVTAAESEWTGFQRENPRAAELEPHIADFLTKYPADNVPVRERLQDAYNWAVAQSPSVAHTDAPPLVQTQTTPAPNPAGKKSISGTGGESRGVRKMSSDDAIRKAVAQLHG